MKAFNEGLRGPPNENGNSMERPWSWDCSDAELVSAIGETLRGMGVHAPEGMGVAEEAENTIADEEWVRFFGMLQGIQGGAGGAGGANAGGR